MEDTHFDPLEIQLENEVMARSVLAYNDRTQKLREKGYETLSHPVETILKVSIDPVSEAFAAWRTGVLSSPGRRATAVHFLDEINPNVFALVVLRSILNSISAQKRIQSVAIRVGGAVEQELLLEAFSRSKEALYKTIDRRISESPLRGQPGYRVRSLTHAARKYGVSTNWDQTARLQVGMLGIDLVREKTGFIQLYPRKDRGRPVAGWFVGPTPELLKHLEEAHKKSSLFLPVTQPMVAVPLDHASTGDGGYYLPPLRRPLVKSSVRHANKLVVPQSAPAVFRAVNGQQRVQWRVNDEVLDPVWDTWQKVGMMPGSARANNIELPPEPRDGTIDHKMWQDKCRDIFIANVRNQGRKLLVIQTIALAMKFRGKVIYFPYQCDFRGRMYAIPSYLNPQGSDLAKGLLTFAKKKVIGERGLYWLSVHTANTAGEDKVSFDERVQWVNEHRKDIEATAEDPLGYRWWHEVDNPVQFLAACIEINKVWKHGTDFESSLPVAFDGACNGLQHLSAMSRDADAGELVNLTPSPKPKSIYTSVAAETNRLMTEEVDAIVSEANPERDRSFAPRWVKFGVGKKATKRPTMIVPYNGTINAFMRYIDLWLDEEGEKGHMHPFPGKEKQPAVRFLASTMMHAINRVVKGPRELMQWSRKAASIVHRSGSMIQWTTPAGFVVVQAYPETKSRIVQTKCGDKVMKLLVREAGLKIDGRRQATGLMPNFIHSYDAACAQFTICGMLDEGIDSFRFNHDEYGCLAADAELLRSINPREFIRVHEKPALVALADELQVQAGAEMLPELPKLGTLDLNDVARSPYYFG